MNRPKLYSDVATNDSDKTLVVPENQTWDILSIFVTLASSADAGNRQLRLVVLDDDDVVVYSIDALATQAANLTYKYAFLPGAVNETQAAKLFLQAALPPRLILPEGWKVRVYDSAAIAATADDMTIQVQYVPQYSFL